MPTIQEQIQSAADQVETDAGLLHQIVHGDTSTVVTVESGSVKSLAKAVAEIGDTSLQAIKDLSNVTTADGTISGVSPFTASLPSKATLAGAAANATEGTTLTLGTSIPGVSSTLTVDADIDLPVALYSSAPAGASV